MSDYSAYALASMADCGSPDSSESPGALLLLSVQTEVNELRNSGSLHEDSAHEIADGAPSIYTYTKWLQFVDLAAWQEDLEDLTCEPLDLDNASTLCLYMIAERLVHALIEDGESNDAG